MEKKTIITLTPCPRCKCSCNKYIGDDKKDYWVRKEVVYSTDCHTLNPILATGFFKIGTTLIKQ